mmetsp:Transcript_91020/g.293848  ORF Transcript_91020/g.293848 Transcript_91020/m.293848 type:complete len:257 (-) Transcript_91020:182-952(-)
MPSGWPPPRGSPDHHWLKLARVVSVGRFRLSAAMAGVVRRVAAALACMAAPASAFAFSAAPQGRAREISARLAASPPPVQPVLGATVSQQAPSAGSTGGLASAVAAAAAVFALGARRASAGRAERAAMAAAKKKPNAKDEKVKRFEKRTGQLAVMNIMRTYNNTHVNLSEARTGRKIWKTTEKRYGKQIGNTTYAVEGAVYTAQALGIDKIFVSMKAVTGIERILATIRGTGMKVQGAVLKNNIAYGGQRACRPRR